MAKAKAESYQGEITTVHRYSVILTIIVEHNITQLPTAFIKRKPQHVVAQIVSSRYNINPDDLCDMHEDGNVAIPNPLHPLDPKNEWPNFLIKQYGAILNEAQTDLILQKWRSFLQTGAKPSIRKNQNRSDHPAFHFGVWRRSKPHPHIAADSNSKKLVVREAGDALLTAIRNHVASKIATLTQSYYPELWQKQKK